VLVVIGASHHDVDLADLEKLSAPEELSGALRALVAQDGSPVDGFVCLTTCNRVEAYLDAARFHDAVDEVVAAVATATGIPADRVSDLLQVRAGSQVAAHLFQVASGLDSMVVGEAEISGQVAGALRRAQAAGDATPMLNRLFQSAAHLAKRVATDIDLGAAGRSVASVALDIAQDRLGPLAGRDVLLIGTGAYARVVASALAERGCERVSVFSASGRQARFAARRGLRAVREGDLPGLLARCDLVVTCSGTGHQALDPVLVRSALTGRDSALCMVDLALHQDVPDAVRQLPGVHVIDLRTAADAAGNAPAQAVRAAEQQVVQAVTAFEAELAARELDPAVVALRNHVTTAVRREMDRLLTRVPPEVAPEVERAAHRMTRSLLHTPTVQARMLARSGDAADYLRALHTLFGIDLAHPDPPGRS
jgi:glutamyl-tRNA reductase